MPRRDPYKGFRITIEHEGWERDRAVAPPED